MIRDLITILVVLLLLTCLVLPAVAGSCGTPVISSSYGHVSYPIQTTSYAVKPIVAYPVFVPTPIYGAYYTPPAPAAPAAPAVTAPQASPCSAEVAELKKELAAMKAYLSQQPQQPAQAQPSQGTPQRPQMPRAGDATGVKAILGQYCGHCHEKALASTEGGGLTLLDNGEIVQLTDKQLAKVVSQVCLGRMPRKETMPKELRSVIVEWVDAQ